MAAHTYQDAADVAAGATNAEVTAATPGLTLSERDLSRIVEAITEGVAANQKLEVRRAGRAPGPLSVRGPQLKLTVTQREHHRHPVPNRDGNRPMTVNLADHVTAGAALATAVSRVVVDGADRVVIDIDLPSCVPDGSHSTSPISAGPGPESPDTAASVGEPETPAGRHFPPATPGSTGGAS